MARKTQPGKAPASAKKSAAKITAAAAAATVRLRMYRLGVGDCFLLRLRRSDGSDYKMLIDCGVHMAQRDGSERIRKAVADLKAETGSQVDVAVATHEHMDHLSGFVDCAAAPAPLKADEIWCAWTEDENDPDRRQLKAKRRKAMAALTAVAARAVAPGASATRERLDSLFGFFGDGTGAKLTKAAQSLRSMSNRAVRYCAPGDKPTEIPGADARVFVLGPPRERALIKRDKPKSGAGTEVYPFGAYNAAAEALDFALDPYRMPFDDGYAIPLQGSSALPFFQSRYWAAKSADLPEADREDTTQDWRRIDADWLESATRLALDLDSDTNNTSLVLAIELGPAKTGGPVLLFAADAQVGNWLSWQNVRWDYEGRTITGPDLLRRTVIYKVGHHASHNATLRELGLEMMDKLELALVPTDSRTAKSVNWGTLPWRPLLERLKEKSRNGVIRTDEDGCGAGTKNFKVAEDDLFYEISF